MPGCLGFDRPTLDLPSLGDVVVSGAKRWHTYLYRGKDAAAKS